MDRMMVQCTVVGLRKKFYLPKPYMGPIFCYWHILIQPLLLGAPFIEIVLCSKVITDFRIRMNQESSERNFTCQNHIWTTIIVTNKFLIWHLLQGATVLICSGLTKFY